MSHQVIKEQLQALADPVRARHALRYFKTGPGEYGEGDRFLGIPVPRLRKLVGEWREATITTARRLISSPWHEIRLFALLLLVQRFQRHPEERERIYRLYLAETRHVNNWDLVDSSAHHIVGAWLEDRDTGPLDRLALSADLWERRIAMVATLWFIRRDRFDPTLRLAARLLDDGEDLMHKATGWMLREVGKRDPEVEREFLRQHHARMPRTALRYAIERFSAAERRDWLEGIVR